jgi:hypothetical protein
LTTVTVTQVVNTVTPDARTTVAITETKNVVEVTDAGATVTITEVIEEVAAAAATTVAVTETPTTVVLDSVDSPHGASLHNIGVPVDIGLANAAGSGLLALRDDHVHRHPALVGQLHPDYGPLVVANTWALRQTMTVGLQFGVAQTIRDSAGADRLFIIAGAGVNVGIAGRLGFTLDPSYITTPAGAHRIGIGDTIGIGDDPTPHPAAILSLSATRVVAGTLRILNINATPIMGGGVGVSIVHVGGTINTAAASGVANIIGLEFVPQTSGGTLSFMTPIFVEARIANTVIGTLRGVHLSRSPFQYIIGAGSGTVAAFDIADWGHVNFPTAFGLRIANQTGSATARLLEALGLTSTNLRVEAGDPTNPGASLGRSQVLGVFNENGALNIRRYEWKDFANLVAGDRVQVAV